MDAKLYSANQNSEFDFDENTHRAIQTGEFIDWSQVNADLHGSLMRDPKKIKQIMAMRDRLFDKLADVSYMIEEIDINGTHYDPLDGLHEDFKWARREGRSRDNEAKIRRGRGRGGEIEENTPR